jgi:hypothetical protein
VRDDDFAAAEQVGIQRVGPRTAATLSISTPADVAGAPAITTTIVAIAATATDAGVRNPATSVMPLAMASNAGAHINVGPSAFAR